MHAKLTEEGKIVDSLQDRSKNLQTEKSALPSGKSPFERERQKQLLQKLKSFVNALRKRKRIFTRSPSFRSGAGPPPPVRLWGSGKPQGLLVIVGSLSQGSSGAHGVGRGKGLPSGP